MATNESYNKQQSIAALPRRKAIKKMRRQGKKWSEIATLFGVTRQRAQQLGKRKDL